MLFRDIAHENVFGDRYGRNVVQLLVDDADTGLTRLKRNLEAHVSAAHSDDAGIRLVHAGEHLDEC